MRRLVRSLTLFGYVALLGGTPPGARATDRPEALRVDGKRIEQRIDTLSNYGRNPEGGVSRVAYSQADIDGRKYVQRLMRDAGLEVRIDAAGNIIGRREGSDPDD